MHHWLVETDADSAADGSHEPPRLTGLELSRPARVIRIDLRDTGQPAERAQQLIDIGFAPGERVTVLARAWPGGDPMVVRIGESRFALRKAEADCIHVESLA